MNTAYYDIHAHLADERILPDLETILRDCRQAGVQGILANSARLDEWPAIVELARTPPVYGALGLHPFFLEEWDEQVPARLEQTLRTHDRLRAVGEIGLDFYPDRAPRDLQIAALSAQLLTAHRLGLPVILHNRKSWSEFFALLNTLDLRTLRGACHHFTGSIEIARQALDRGFYLSFCGPVTYASARRLKAAAAYVPLERILTETDTPDLPPAGFERGYSYPYHVREVVRELARLKGMSEPDVAAHVAANFRELLGLAEDGTPGAVTAGAGP